LEKKKKSLKRQKVRIFSKFLFLLACSISDCWLVSFYRVLFSIPVLNSFQKSQSQRFRSLFRSLFGSQKWIRSQSWTRIAPKGQRCISWDTKSEGKGYERISENRVGSWRRKLGVAEKWQKNWFWKFFFFFRVCGLSIVFFLFPHFLVSILSTTFTIHKTDIIPQIQPHTSSKSPSCLVIPTIIKIQRFFPLFSPQLTQHFFGFPFFLIFNPLVNYWHNALLMYPHESS